MYISFGGPIFLIAVGAILRYATDFSISSVDMNVVGVILMVAGVAILILSFVIAGFNRKDRRDVVDRPPTRRPPPPPR